MATTIQMPDEITGRLDALAQTMGRTRDDLLMEAVVRYLDEEAAYLAEVEEGRQEADAGLFVPEDEMEAFWARFTPPEGTAPVVTDITDISEEELLHAQRVSP